MNLIEITQNTLIHIWGHRVQFCTKWGVFTPCMPTQDCQLVWRKSPREMNHVNQTLKYSSIPFLIFSNLVIESIGYCIKKESTSIVLDMWITLFVFTEFRLGDSINVCFLKIVWVNMFNTEKTSPGECSQ